MSLLEPVGALWYDPSQGVAWSGRITLPRPLPAGVSLQVIAVPKPLRGRKEKYDLHLEIPWPPPPPEPPGPDDIIIRGEIMSQYFKPPRPSHRRHKILIWGPSGTGKTTLALQFPHCAFIDNHGSAEKYEAAYPQHLFAHPTGPDDTMAAVASLVKDPADRKTLVLDDLTSYWGQVQEKWGELFLTRLPKSKGHHAEFYSFQPSDWIHPKRELKALIMRAIALDMNVIAIARAQKEYAGEGDNFMKVIGETFAGEKNLPYEFDYIIELRREGDKRIAVVHKQRIAPGQKPLPEKFEFSIDAQGKSNFVEFLAQYGNPEELTRDAQRVPDPVQAQEPLSSEPVAGDAPGPTASQPPPPPGHGSTTEVQLNRLKELKTHYKIGNPEWGQTLQKFYGKDTARQITPDQADHFIQFLESKHLPF